MRLIVGVGVVVLMALNPPSTARAATGCIVAGTRAGGAHGLVALRPGRRLDVSWHGAAGTPGRALPSAICLGVFV